MMRTLTHHRSMERVSLENDFERDVSWRVDKTQEGVVHRTRGRVYSAYKIRCNVEVVLDMAIRMGLFD